MTQEQERDPQVHPELGKKVKFTVELWESDIEDLKTLARKRNNTMTEALRGAIATEKYLREEIGHGAELLIDFKGCIHKMILK